MICGATTLTGTDSLLPGAPGLCIAEVQFLQSVFQRLERVWLRSFHQIITTRSGCTWPPLWRPFAPLMSFYQQGKVSLPRYALEQFKAETAAWETAEREDLDLVTLLPSQVVGPLLSTSSGVSGPSVSWMKVCSLMLRQSE